MDIVSILKSFTGTFFTTLIFVGLYFLTKFLLDKQRAGKTHESSVLRSIVLFSLGLIAVISILLSFPFSESMKGQISSLIGIVLAAVLSLSSATFIGNAFAGIMIRAINNFKPGDFIRVGEYFGRISERGLFHTEIQTENRDLTTLPNLFLATNPVKVTRSSGSFISAVCSLGYDVSRIKIENALIQAAKNTGLEDPFVLIESLGDFSVVYRVRGLLKDVKTFISSKSKLNAMVLDSLHEAGIEIVSPNFMNQRQIGDAVFIPQKPRKKEEAQLEENTGKPDAAVFDKAEEAETLESRRSKVAEIETNIKNLQAELKVSNSEVDKLACQNKIDKLTGLKNKLIDRINKEL